MAIPEILVLLLSMLFLGVEPNPNAPSADEVLRYAPAEADYMLHVDLQAGLPRAFAEMERLPSRKELPEVPEVRKIVEEVVAGARRLRSEGQMLLGMDVIVDLHSVTAWVEIPVRGDPRFLVVARGQFPDALVGNLAGGQAPRRVDGRPFALLDKGVALASASDGALLAGTPEWVRARMRDRWRPRASRHSRAAAPLLEEKPFLLLTSAPSKRAVGVIRKALRRDDERVFRDLFTGHHFAAIAVRHDGVTWTLRSRTKAGHDLAVWSSEGILDLLRASHFTGRGMARMALAVMESYADEPVLKAIVSKREALYRLLADATGDGRFDAKVQIDDGTKTVTVVARGKSLHEVVPTGGILPLVAAAVLWAVM